MRFPLILPLFYEQNVPFISTGSARDVGKDDIALLGLFDLLIKHTEINACFAFIEEFLRETQRSDLYHYVLTALITSMSPDPWTS